MRVVPFTTDQEGHVTLIRRLCIGAVMMAAMLLGGAPAFATEPLTTSGYVSDPDGFLSEEQRGTIEIPRTPGTSTSSLSPRSPIRNHRGGAGPP